MKVPTLARPVFQRQKVCKSNLVDTVSVSASLFEATQDTETVSTVTNPADRTMENRGINVASGALLEWATPRFPTGHILHEAEDTTPD